MATRPATVTLSSASDAELLGAIARRQDRDAFSEIYSRYEKAAFNLAQFLTRNKDFAEEAVQEGFLAVWRSANTFRSDGSPRSWVLRIVAMKSLQILRRRRRTEAKIERAQQASTPPETDVLAADAERGELLASLRRHLERLPDLERELIALYYGGDLSQAQIAEQLEMPERTVSFRIQKALEQLRTRLAGAGFTAALPLAGTEFSGELLRGALLDAGPSVPASLGTSVLGQLAAKAANVSKASARAAAGSSSAGLYVATAVLLAAGAGTFAWMQQEPNPPQAKAPLEAKTEASAQPAPAAPKERPLYQAHWSFEKGPPTDLVALYGTWTWGKGPDGAGEMQPQGHPQLPPDMHRVMVKIPQVFGARPVRFDFKVRATNADNSSFDVTWTTATGDPMPYRQWGQIVRVRDVTGNLSAVAIDRYVILFMQGHPFTVSEYQSAYPSRNLIFLLSNTAVREITVRELPADDPSLRDIRPEELKKSLTPAPSTSRRGTPRETPGPQ
ncbi:MAG: sigma-70 family RNA polymerase sigma factor [Planctomycetes bacterium]|nr:sigma-70 family RNA polymerase sigma factor [Planctomycetota bacterium]